jgi:hypothetical protein
VDVGEDLHEHGAVVVALPVGDDHRQGSAAPVDSLMDLRRQPAAGAADPVTGWFNLAERQIVVIRSRPLSCSGRAVFVAC